MCADCFTEETHHSDANPRNCAEERKTTAIICFTFLFIVGTNCDSNKKIIS